MIPHTQGNGTHGPLDLADFQGFAGPYRMAAGSNGHSFCYRIRDVEQFAEERCQHSPLDASDHHRPSRNAGNSPAVFRNPQGNGRGNAFGQHGGRKHGIGLEQVAQCQSRRDTPQAPCCTPHQDRQEVLLEHFPLLVDIEGQYCRSRTQEHGDHGASHIEMFQRDTSDRQDHHDHQRRSQHRIAQQPACFFLELHPQHPADKDQGQGKERGTGKGFRHGRLLSSGGVSSKAGHSSRQ